MKIFMIIKGALVIVGMVTYLFRPSQCEGGIVADRIYLPPYVTEVDSYSIAMDAPMKEKRKHREKYILVLEVNEQTKECEVSDDVYKTYYVGDKFAMK